MIPTSIESVTCPTLQQELVDSFREDIPEGIATRMYRQGTAFHAAYVDEGRIVVQPLGFVIPLVEVTDAVRASDPRAAFDCQTGAMDGILDDAPLQWFRAGDQHYAVFMLDGTIQMHPCDISYDHERVAA